MYYWRIIWKTGCATCEGLNLVIGGDNESLLDAGKLYRVDDELRLNDGDTCDGQFDLVVDVLSALLVQPSHPDPYTERMTGEKTITRYGPLAPTMRFRQGGWYSENIIS